MQPIEAFIQSAAWQLHVSEETAAAATGELLKLIKNEMPVDAFGELASELPGAAALLPGEPAAEDRGPAAGLGDVDSTFGSGGEGAGVLGALGALSCTGLGIEQVAPFSALFMSFVKSATGEGLYYRILLEVADLRKLLT